MTNLIHTEFNWDAASKQVLSNLDNANTGARERVEKHIGALMLKKHRWPDIYTDEPYALATLFFDMHFISFNGFENANDGMNIWDKDDNVLVSQEEFMLRLMELQYAIEVVYGDLKGHEAFNYYMNGRHDT
jgi:hypothetical protein